MDTKLGNSDRTPSHNIALPRIMMRLRLRPSPSVILFLLIILASSLASAQNQQVMILRSTLQNLLAAVENRNGGQIHLLSTKKGYQFLVRALNRHPDAAKILKAMGTSSAVSHVRWINLTNTSAQGQVKWVMFNFVVEDGRWKFDGAAPA